MRKHWQLGTTKPRNIFWDKKNTNCTFRNLNRKYKKWWMYWTTIKETGRRKYTKRKWSVFLTRLRIELRVKNNITGKEFIRWRENLRRKRTFMNFRSEVFRMSWPCIRESSSNWLQDLNNKKDRPQALSYLCLVVKTSPKDVLNRLLSIR